MKKELHKKIDFAIHLLQSIPTENEIELAYSGGKDSDVILELAKMAEIKYRPIYKSTTIDPIGTIRYVESKGVEIRRPAKTFLQLVEEKGMPTRRARFCCSELKKYKILDYAIQGIRKEESYKRSAIYKEPEICKSYSKKDKVKIYLPILEWSQEDVEEFVKERNIKCHNMYYDEEGYFHPERRLGCIGCPLKSDNGKSDFVRFPKLLKQIVKRCRIFLENHPNATSNHKFENEYNLVFNNLFCSNYEEYYYRINGGLFPETSLNAKTFLENYFNIKL